MSGRSKALFGLAAALIVAVVALPRIVAAGNESRYRRQIALARAEGIPTSAAEYAALIPPALPAENAAHLYRTLSLMHTDLGKRYLNCDRDVIFDPTPVNLALAKEYLTKLGPKLKVADAATKFPRCWFNRNWDDGPAVLFPEYADMKGAAKAVALRGSLASAAGDPKSAVAAVEEIFTISRHAGEEPHSIARLVRESIYLVGLQHLGNWAFVHPEQSLYRAELQTALAALPKPDFAAEHSDALYNMLWILDNSSTPQGRKKIGIPESDVGLRESLAAFFTSQSGARVRIVELMRQRMLALRLPPSERGAILDATESQIGDAIGAFPTAKRVEAIDEIAVSTDRGANWEASRLRYVAFLRAMSHGRPAAWIDTHDLINPINGKRVEYHFDGRTIRIHAEGREDLVIPTKRQ
jgi:hypothetical protein